MTDVKKIFDKNLEKKFSVKISAENLKKQIEEEALKEQKKLKVDGFRVGKVPVEFIKNKYSAVLLSDAAESLVDQSVNKIIKENNFNLISRPKIEVKNLENNKDFDFEVSFELYPEIPEIKLNKMHIKKQKINVSKKDIDEGKNKLLKSKAKWAEEGKDYQAKLGDKVKIDFLGKIKDVPFEGGKAENYELELGSKSFIDSFEDQLVGKKAGDNVDVKVTFPENYQKKELSGQPAVFEVKIHSISTSKLPELTNEFLKENFAIETIEKLEEIIQKELSEMYTNTIRNYIKEEVFEWLKSNVKFDMPKSIIDEEFDRQWKSVEDELKNNPNKFKDDKEKEKEKEKVRKDAEDSVKLGLILSEIGKINDIKVEDTEVIESLRRMASAYPGQEQMIIDFYMKNKSMLNQITGNLLENKVIDYITSKADVEEIETTIEDFLASKKK